MMKLLLISDDLTGALDAGIKFAQRGLRTSIVPHVSGCDFEQLALEDAEILVVNSDSRPMAAKEAYRTVQAIGSAGLRLGVEYIFKKVDSALRGNIGSELAALVDLMDNEAIYFAPAYPAMNRITMGGVHYIDGVALNESVFANDPFDPREDAYVPSILKKQTSLPVQVIGRDESLYAYEYAPGKAICLFDADSDERLREIAVFLQKKGKPSLCAGCAGFAEAVAGLLVSSAPAKPEIPAFRHFVVICGSLNPITLEQLDYAARLGAKNIHLSEEERGGHRFWSGPAGREHIAEIAEAARCGPVLIDTRGPSGSGKLGDRVLVASSLGRLAAELMEKLQDCLFMITGGDTLLEAVRQMPNAVLIPVCQVLEGAVLLKTKAGGREIYMISKSGGFCGPDAMDRIFHALVTPQPREEETPYV